MPWCEDCAKYWAPIGDERRRHVPDVRRRAGRRAPSNGPASGAADDEKAPWHFKLLVVVLVVYLGMAAT